MLKPAILACFFLASCAFAQQDPQSQPQVKMNILNVCTPSAEEQAQIKSAFAKVQAKPVFGRDFEVSRGQATLKDAPDSRFVRLRRDFVAESPLLTAQYSMSSDDTSTIETLVLRTRDAKDFHELALEDRVTAGAISPESLLTVDTPVIRVRVERLSKSSVVLARCQDSDQSAYEPLFRQASEIMAQYRAALGLRGTLRTDIAWLTRPAKSSNPGHTPPTSHK